LASIDSILVESVNFEKETPTITQGSKEISQLNLMQDAIGSANLKTI
jgi:hypothetical protein